MLGDTDLIELKHELQDDRDLISVDRALNSPSYIAITGRNHARFYVGYGNKLFTCAHPNIENCTIILPEIGSENGELLRRVIMHYAGQNRKIELARLRQEHFSHFHMTLPQNHLPSYHNISIRLEERLDWLYPVRIINCQDIKDRKGGGFVKLRYSVNRLAKHHNIEEISLNNFKSECGDKWQDVIFQNQWAPQKLASQDGDYYTFLFKLIDTFPELYDGIIFKKGEQLVGLTIWETEIGDSGEAIVLANLCDINLYGLSAYQLTKSCEYALPKGITHLNFGGSETRGLDDFKRKIFQPERSIELRTADILYDTDIGTLMIRDIIPERSSRAQM